LRSPEVPKPFADFLVDPPAGTAVADYERWQSALTAAFGARRFVPLAIEPDAIYPATE